MGSIKNLGLSSFWSFVNGRHNISESSEAVRKELEAFSVSYTMTMLHWLQVIYSFLIPITMLASSYLTHGNLVWSLLALYAVSLAITSCGFGQFSTLCAESKLKLSTAVCRVVLALVIHRSITFTGSPYVWYVNSPCRAVLRTVTCVCLCKHTEIIAWNSAQMIADVSTNYRLYELVKGDIDLNFFTLAAPDMLLAIMISILVKSVESWLTQRTGAVLQAQSSTQEAAGARKLLSAFCETQVHLDSELRIYGEHKRLSQMLMLQDAERPTEAKTSFLDFIAEGGDRHRFESFISAATSNLSGSSSMLPGCLPISLKDTTGQVVDVEVFHIFFPSQDGQAGHLIGIRETGMRHIREAGAAPVMPLHSGNARTASITSQGRTSKSSRSLRSSKSSGTGLLFTKPCAELLGITMTVDMFDENFPAEEIQISFDKDECSKSNNFCLKPWAVEFDSFQNWARGIVCESMCESHDDDDDSEPKSHIFKDGLTLTLPLFKDSSLRLRADCVQVDVRKSKRESEDTDDSSDTSSASDDLQTSIVLSNFSVQRRGRKHSLLTGIAE
eukprot:TRINITY_DN10979_c0_g1_i1.p1 TRINITY_DN10979_c0_g1~~TRINITY_DN10979_c0_g1_i1.p1  ORF type:complete len:625 (-),score=79.07 TRINITY_DN10979_c0_g1_i1:302-1972(-)